MEMYQQQSLVHQADPARMSSPLSTSEGTDFTDSSSFKAAKEGDILGIKGEDGNSGALTYETTITLPKPTDLKEGGVAEEIDCCQQQESELQLVKVVTDSSDQGDDQQENDNSNINKESSKKGRLIDPATFLLDDVFRAILLLNRSSLHFLLSLRGVSRTWATLVLAALNSQLTLTLFPSGADGLKAYVRALVANNLLGDPFYRVS